AHLLRPLLRLAGNDPTYPIAAVRDGDQFVDVPVGDFAARVRRLAKGLVAAGVVPGDRVALMSHTRFEWLLVDYAILHAGGVTVPIYDTSSAEQVQWIISDSGSVVFVIETPAMREMYEQMSSLLPDCRRLVTIDEGGLEQLEHDGADIGDEAIDERLAALEIDALATIVYTSGTTGRPKGCMLTHRNLRTNVVQSLDAIGSALQPDDSALLFLPLAHTLTKTTALFVMEAGCREAFATDIPHLPEEFAMTQPTVICAVPRIFEKVFNSARHHAHAEHKGWIFDRAADIAIRWSRERVAGRVMPWTGAGHAVFDRLVYGKVRAALGGNLRLAFSGGAPLGERLTHFFAGIGLDVYEGYGLTETGPTLTVNRPGAWKPGTVGRPVAGTSIRIAPDGEILAKGPQVFQGYWHNADATAAAFDANGWFMTGDIGEVDAEGYLRITGRKKELLVTAAGKNVAPAPLEDRLRSHELISQAVVVGDQQPFIAALITIDEAAFQLWAKEHGHDDESIADLREADALRSVIQLAVDDANRSVSHAESIRKFVILPNDLSIEADELTPTMKVRRAIVAKTYAGFIDAIYTE
ncbi:MAG: AMP-dependent synthetase/ligase, partial [Actinomycetota bacterium]|nr:AMP-dependent synthetase/ligase [Actinomycetota bacterium]